MKLRGIKRSGDTRWRQSALLATAMGYAGGACALPVDAIFSNVEGWMIGIAPLFLPGILCRWLSGAARSPSNGNGARTAAGCAATDVLNALTDHIAILDACGTILYVNDAWRRSPGDHGFGSDKAGVGSCYLDETGFFGASADETRQLREGVRKVLSGAWPAFVHEYPCASTQEQQWMQLRAHPFSSADGRGLILSRENISATRRAMQSLMRSEECLRQITNTIEDIYWVTELPGHRVVYVSPSFERLWGISRAELYREPMRWLLAIDGDDRPKVEAALVDVVGSGRLDIEYRIVRDDGARRWIRHRVFSRRNACGTVDRLVGVAEDITERKLADDALRISEARYRALVSAMPQIVWRCDPSGAVLFASPRWLELTGQTEAELLAFGWVGHIHQDDRARMLNVRRQAIASGESFEEEARIYAKDGSQRWLRFCGVPVRDDDGSIREWVATAIDIDDHRRAEDALAADARSKDRFLAMLAHELRNPLAPIRSAAQTLSRLDLDDAQAVWASRAIDRQTNHLARLVDDLLDVSRIIHGKVELRVEPLDFRAVVRQAVESLRERIDRRTQRLDLALPPDAVPVEGDGVRLLQVVSNVLDNATKYTPKHGRIALSLDRRDGQACLTVRDNGIGIHPDLLPKVFDLFAQADDSLARSQGGLGIGLTVARDLVDGHRGRIDVVFSKPGEGTEFAVWLPLAKGKLPPVAAPAESTADEPVELGRHRILVVDDNADAASSLAMMFQMDGYEVQTALDGIAALAAFDTFQPQVVLLDIGLPGMDGYEVARELRSRPQGLGVRLIALTGYGRPEDRSRSRDAGFDHHLIKPVDWSELNRLLAEPAAGPSD